MTEERVTYWRMRAEAAERALAEANHCNEIFWDWLTYALLQLRKEQARVVNLEAGIRELWRLFNEEMGFASSSVCSGCPENVRLLTAFFDRLDIKRLLAPESDNANREAKGD